MSFVPNLNDTTPAAPAGNADVKWQKAASSSGTDTNTGLPIYPVSAYIPATGGVAAKTASYTATAADCGKLLSFNSASAVTLTLPAAIPFAAWNLAVENTGAGALTVSPNGLTLDGSSSSLTLNQNQGCYLATDGTNYFTQRGAASGAAGVSSLNGLTGSLSINAGANITVTPSGSSITIAATGGGGGGGLGITLFNGVAGLAPTKSGTGLTTGMNQSGTFSATDLSGIGIFMEDRTASSVENVEGLLSTYPSSPFTLTAVLSVPGGTQYNLAGVIIAVSASGKLMFFGARWNPSPGWTAIAYNSPTSFNSFISPFTTGNQSNFSAALLGIKIKDDGTNITVWFSVDGLAWTQATTFSKASSFVGSTGFNYLGFIIDTDNGPSSTTLLAWNITHP